MIPHPQEGKEGGKGRRIRGRKERKGEKGRENSFLTVRVPNNNCERNDGTKHHHLANTITTYSGKTPQ